MYNLIFVLNDITIYSSLFLFIVTFVNLFHVKRYLKGRTLTVTALLSVFFLTLATPVVIFGLCCFWLLRFILGIVLRILYRDRFMGFFSNIDAIHGRSVVGKCTINVLLVTECKDKTIRPEDIFQSVNNTIDNVIKNRNVGKLFSTLRHCLGYRFLLKRNRIHTSDCVKKMTVISGTNALTKSDLMNLLEHYTKQPFPFDNEFLWDVHVGTQPVLWRTESNNNYYPILFRFHHSVADGINISNFIVGVCGYTTTSDNTIITVKKKTNSLIQWCKLITNTMLCFILFSAVAYTSLRIKNDNLSFISSNRRKKGGSVVLKAEESNLRLKKIQNICNDCEVYFTAVLAAAFSASINDYYISHYDMAPEYLTTMIPVCSDALTLRDLQPGSKKLSDINFCNDYEISCLKLPIGPQDIPRFDKSSMIDRLGLVMENMKLERQRSIFRVVFNQFTKIHFTVSPAPFLKLSTYFTECGPIISNIPGTPKMCLGEALLPISDCIFFVPDMKRCSFVLNITTYDNRLQLAIGTSLDIKRNELQKVLNNIYKYIDLLEKEIDCLSAASENNLRKLY